MSLTNAPYLARIDLYPIKSLDGISVPTVSVLESGALQHDRAWAIVDGADKFVNGKRCVHIHRVRSRFNDDITQVTLGIDALDQIRTFSLELDQAGINQWLSDYLRQSVTLQRNLDMGFPDDTDSPGPTIVSTATLQTVATWYDLPLADIRRRFRTNLEIDGVPPFWEDRLFSGTGDPVPFRIGGVTWYGINPCQRCVVPTRDPQRGQGTPDFQKTFVQQRAATLPVTVARSRFNHFYRLAVNTRLAPGSRHRTLAVGDAVSLEE